MLSSVEVFAMVLKMRFAFSKHSNQQIEIARVYDAEDGTA